MKTKTFPVEKRDIISLFLTVVSLFILSRIGILGGFNIGFSIGCGIALTIGFVYAWKKESTSKLLSVILYLLSMALVVSFSLTSDAVIKFCTIVYLPFVCCFLICNVSNNITLKQGTYKSFIAMLGKTIDGTLVKLEVTFKSYIERITKNKSKNAVYIILGIIITVPLLCIVLPLLSSSDIAFGSLVKSIFKNACRLVLSLIITLGISPFVYSFLFSMRKQSVEDFVVKPSKNKTPNILFNIVLSAVSVVYCAYAVSQLAYITKAFAFLLPEDFTAAQFARSGFFQMGAISFINFLILSLTAMLVKRKGRKIPTSTKGLLVFLCLFTIFYISTAIVKMLKYISLYGLTHLRVLTSVFMVMLAVISVILLLRLFITKIKYAKAVVLVCTISLLLVAAVDTKTVIAEYNYNQYQKGNIQIDIEQIGTLGVSGIPTLIKLTEDDDKKIADGAINELLYRCSSVYENAFDKEETDEKLAITKGMFYEKNLSWIKARKVLDEFIKKNPSLDRETFDEYYYKTYLSIEEEELVYEDSVIE